MSEASVIEPVAEPAPATEPAAPTAEPAKAEGPAPAEPVKDEPKPEPAPAVTSWRDTLPDDLKKHAERFNSVEDLVKANVDSRQKLSKAVVPPGKGATADDIAAYRKAIGVPEKADGYKFEMPEGKQASDDDKAFHGKMAEAFHALNVSADQAKGLNKVWNDLMAAGQQAQADADKKYAEQTEAALKKSWGAEYETNRAHADRAASWAFGDQIEEFRHIETKDGRFLADHPLMTRALAQIGREMQEGQMVPPLSGDAAEAAQDEIRDLQKKIEAAQSSGDTERANTLYQKKLDMISKTQGNRPIVGSHGRAA